MPGPIGRVICRRKSTALWVSARQAADLCVKALFLSVSPLSSGLWVAVLAVWIHQEERECCLSAPVRSLHLCGHLAHNVRRPPSTFLSFPTQLHTLDNPPLTTKTPIRPPPPPPLTKPPRPLLLFPCFFLLPYHRPVLVPPSRFCNTFTYHSTPFSCLTANFAPA